MTRCEQENWICNLQSVANEVSTRWGTETVQHILGKYGANCIENLASCYYSEAFDELDFMASDAYD